MITVSVEIYGARGSSLYLMTGTCDVTMCTDIVYGKHFRTHLSQISLASTKNHFSGTRTWTRINLRTVYTIAILTSLLRRVNSTLQHGTNISISEICVEWSVFSGMVTFIYGPYIVFA